MRQNSMKERHPSNAETDDMVDDALLDDEGWDLLNSLTEEELEQLNNDFDPENSLIPVQDRSSYSMGRSSKPMFNKEDLLEGLEKMVENSKTVFKNEKIREKEEVKKKQKEEKLKRQYSKDKPDIEPPKQIALTAEEEELLNEATEEELIEAAEIALSRDLHEVRERLLVAIDNRRKRRSHLVSFVSNEVSDTSTSASATGAETTSSPPAIHHSVERQSEPYTTHPRPRRSAASPPVQLNGQKHLLDTEDPFDVIADNDIELLTARSSTSSSLTEVAPPINRIIPPVLTSDNSLKQSVLSVKPVKQSSIKTSQTNNVKKVSAKFTAKVNNKTTVVKTESKTIHDGTLNTGEGPKLLSKTLEKNESQMIEIQKPIAIIQKQSQTLTDNKKSQKESVSNPKTPQNQIATDNRASQKETPTGQKASQKQTSTNNNLSKKETREDYKPSKKETPTDYESIQEKSPTDHESSQKVSPTDYKSIQEKSPTDHESSQKVSPTDYKSIQEKSPTDHESSQKVSPTDYKSIQEKSPTDHKPSQKETPTDYKSIQEKSAINHIPSKTGTTGRKTLQKETPTNNKPSQKQSSTDYKLSKETPKDQKHSKMETPTDTRSSLKQTPTDYKPSQKETPSYKLEKTKESCNSGNSFHTHKKNTAHKKTEKMQQPNIAIKFPKLNFKPSAGKQQETNEKTKSSFRVSNEKKPTIIDDKNDKRIVEIEVTSKSIEPTTSPLKKEDKINVGQPQTWNPQQHTREAQETTLTKINHSNLVKRETAPNDIDITKRIIDDDEAVKKFKKLKTCLPEKSTVSKRKRRTSKEYSIDKVRKYNEKVKEYNSRVEVENRIMQNRTPIEERLMETPCVFNDQTETTSSKGLNNKMTIDEESHVLGINDKNPSQPLNKSSEMLLSSSVAPVQTMLLPSFESSEVVSSPPNDSKNSPERCCCVKGQSNEKVDGETLNQQLSSDDNGDKREGIDLNLSVSVSNRKQTSAAHGSQVISKNNTSLSLTDSILKAEQKSKYYPTDSLNNDELKVALDVEVNIDNSTKRNLLQAENSIELNEQLEGAENAMVNQMINQIARRRAQRMNKMRAVDKPPTSVRDVALSPIIPPDVDLPEKHLVKRDQIKSIQQMDSNDATSDFPRMKKMNRFTRQPSDAGKPMETQRTFDLPPIPQEPLTMSSNSNFYRDQNGSSCYLYDSGIEQTPSDLAISPTALAYNQLPESPEQAGNDEEENLPEVVLRRKKEVRSSDRRKSKEYKHKRMSMDLSKRRSGSFTEQKARCASLDFSSDTDTHEARRRSGSHKRYKRSSSKINIARAKSIEKLEKQQHRLPYHSFDKSDQELHRSRSFSRDRSMSIDKKDSTKLLRRENSISDRRKRMEHQRSGGMEEENKECPAKFKTHKAKFIEKLNVAKKKALAQMLKENRLKVQVRKENVDQEKLNEIKKSIAILIRHDTSKTTKISGKEDEFSVSNLLSKFSQSIENHQQDYDPSKKKAQQQKQSQQHHHHQQQQQQQQPQQHHQQQQQEEELQQQQLQQQLEQQKQQQLKQQQLQQQLEQQKLQQIQLQQQLQLQQQQIQQQQLQLQQHHNRQQKLSNQPEALPEQKTSQRQETSSAQHTDKSVERFEQDGSDKFMKKDDQLKKAVDSKRDQKYPAKPKIVVGLETEDDFFTRRRKNRMKELDGNINEMEHQNKISISRQIDLFNLQKTNGNSKFDTLKFETDKSKDKASKINQEMKEETKEEANKKQTENPKHQEKQAPFFKKKITENKKDVLENKSESKRNALEPNKRESQPANMSPFGPRKIFSKPKSREEQNPPQEEMSQQRNIRKTDFKANLKKIETKDNNKKESSSSFLLPEAERQHRKISSGGGLAALLAQDEKDRESLKFGEKPKKTGAEEKEDIRGISAASLQKALLKMNGILTNEQIQSVWAGDKPKGSLTKNTSVKATPIKKDVRISKKDEETELDVVELMKHIKEDSDSLFYLCINNEPKLERKVKESLIKAVETSKKIRHVSFAMIGLIDHEVKKLAEAIRYNDKIETLNLESNVITQHGLTPLMKEISRHPSIREVKISNQKQPFGGQGEECMATAIDKNDNILKFGYSFQHAGPRNKADRAIIRHNEALRQKRRNGEEVYDLKAVCKIRDPSPQPWIKVKNRRGLGGLIESKASEIGNRIDTEGTGRESRDSDSRPKNPMMDINALLSQRKAKLKGTKIEELEQEQERKRKQQFKEMHESEANADENNNKNEKSLKNEIKESPPVITESPPVKTEEPKKHNISPVQRKEEDTFARRRRKEIDDEDEGGIDFSAFENKTEEKSDKTNELAEIKAKEEEERKQKKAEEEKRKAEEAEKERIKKEQDQAEAKRKANLVKIKPLEKKEEKPRFRRRKYEEEDEGGIDFTEFETKSEEKPNDESRKTEADDNVNNEAEKFDRKETEEAEKKEAEEDDEKRKAKEEEERKEKEEAERKEKEEAERKEKEEAKRKEKEEAEMKEKERIETERKEKERIEAEKKEKEEAERKAKQEAAKSEPVFDIFGDRNDDDGEPKKLSLRERMARRGR